MKIFQNEVQNLCFVNIIIKNKIIKIEINPKNYTSNMLLDLMV